MAIVITRQTGMTPKEFLEASSTIATTYPISFSCFFYVPTGSAVNGALFSIGKNSTNNDNLVFYVSPSDQKIKFDAIIGGSPIAAIIATTTTWSFDTWHHAMLVVDSTPTADVWLDGAGNASGSAGSFPSGTNTTAIGRRVKSSAAGRMFLNARVAEACVWNGPIATRYVEDALGKFFCPISVRWALEGSAQTFDRETLGYWNLFNNVKDYSIQKVTLVENGAVSYTDHPRLIYQRSV